jgi:hypothetical protein
MVAVSQSETVANVPKHLLRSLKLKMLIYRHEKQYALRSRKNNCQVQFEVLLLKALS